MTKPTARCLALWLNVMAGVPALVSAGLPEELSDCAAITDDRARLVCYDALHERLQRPVAQSAGEMPDQTPVSENPPQESLVDANTALPELSTETRGRGNWLGIKPYRRNYILPLTYNDNANDQLYEDEATDFSIEDVEIKFQLSFELPVWKSIYDQDLDLYFAYSQLSFFQAYNKAYSSPFRDTVYEPEMGLNWHPGLTFMDWRLTSARLALNHQSNGRTEPLSRSWNRLIGQFEAEHGNLGLGLRLWHRFQEDAEEDDNPDITDYMGYGELHFGYDLGPHSLGLMVRNPLEHAAVQIGWSRLLNERVRFYVQYYNGYGESLIDYNQQVNRLGVGFLLNEWP
jgi:phospholipase A1